jgi:GNAT superfamily N-acetyltransferase
MPLADLTFVRRGAEEAPAILDEVCAVYADAYGHLPSGEDGGVKVAAFRERATKAMRRPSFEMVTAHVSGDLAGFAFGYALTAATHWWDDLVPAPPSGFFDEDGHRTVVLAEIAVRQRWQGSGVGRRLHEEVLGHREEQRATLATGPGADTARAIYEGWGWEKLGVVPGTIGDYFSEYTLYVLQLPFSPKP